VRAFNFTLSMLDYTKTIWKKKLLEIV
jgi:hypothetical protein